MSDPLIKISSRGVENCNNTLIAISFGKNPINGGNPANDSRLSIKTIDNWWGKLSDILNWVTEDLLRDVINIIKVDVIIK